MRVCLVHNSYGATSGEDVLISNIAKLLRERGHEVYCFFRSSREILDSFLLKTKAFFSGIYSFHSQTQMRQVIFEFKPDIIHVQNLYPLISPSILVEAALQRIPVVMLCQNYRLICPNGLFMTKGQVCKRCSGGREYWCILRNCERNLFKSLGYTLRNYVARKQRYFLDNVTVYYVATQFHRRGLIQEGLPADRVEVIPNSVDPTGIQVSKQSGDYVGFVGRISPEKGVDVLMKAAEQLPKIPFKVVGNYNRMPELLKKAPRNLEFVGHLPTIELYRFYSNIRFLVMPTICYEAFGLVVIEAMLRGKPVICSRISGLPEIVDDGVTGLLFEPGNTDDLTEKIRYLWDRLDLCREMGLACREKALREYPPEKYYERLIAVYQKAQQLVQADHR